MRVAVIGIRGVPARYGGLETCAQEVGSRLVTRGHEVFCYCRSKSVDDGMAEYMGIRRIEVPCLDYRPTGTYSHTIMALTHIVATRLKPDVIMAFNPGIGTLSVIPKVLGYRIALNPDGFDWRRKKWGWFARSFIYASANVASRVCDQLIIDAVSVRDFYAQTFKCRREPIYLPNGAAIETSQKPELIEQFGLKKDGYFLFLSRFVPENSCDIIIKAFEGLKTDKKLFMGGGTAKESRYAASIMQTKDPRIVFPGPIYDPDAVRELHCGAYALLHGNQPGGTSLGLLKALGYGTCVLTLNTPDNAYAVKNAGLTYELSVDSVRERLQFLIDHPDEVQAMRRKAIDRIREEYLWEVITDKYEAVLQSLCKNGHAK